MINQSRAYSFHVMHLYQPPRVLGDWNIIIKLLIGKGVLRLCAFDVLYLPIEEKVKIAESFAGHIAPLALTGACLYCACMRVKEFLKKSSIQPKCRKWYGNVENGMEMSKMTSTKSLSSRLWQPLSNSSLNWGCIRDCMSNAHTLVVNSTTDLCSQLP